MRDRYTHYPRAILWLIRGGEAAIGGKQIPVEAFYLSKLPITNIQFEAFDPAFNRVGTSAADDDTVVGVNFEQARGYCEWYAGVSRKPMRLPSEIEWEYACRAETTSKYFFGDSTEGADRFIWHAGNSTDMIPPLHKVQPNPFGLHSMLGGVWEWTSSLYRPYPVPSGDGRDEREAVGRRVLRGGSFRVDRDAVGAGYDAGAFRQR